MANQSNPKDRLPDKANEYSSLAFHPHNVILMLLIFSLSMIFITLSGAFVYNRIQSNLPPIKLPFVFIFNTLLLVGSSAAMLWAKKHYIADNTQLYKKALLTTLILSIFFLLLQVIGWRVLLSQNEFSESSNSIYYLYALSGLHFLHVIVGIPILSWFLWQAQKCMVEPVSVLVYFSDPAKQLKLRLLSIYWHFLDILWLYLVLFFFINYLLQ